MKLSEVLKIVRPQYVYIRLKPTNSTRNNNTHKLVRAIAMLYKGMNQNIRSEQHKLVKTFGKQFFVGTKYALYTPAKVGFYLYMERNQVGFYLVVPAGQLSYLEEKISDTWSTVTLEKVESLPMFTDSSTKYQIVYEKEDALSLVTDRRDNEWLHSSLNVIEALEDGDRAGVYMNFIPTSQRTWRHTYRHTLEKVKKGHPTERNKMGWGYALKMALSVTDTFLREIGEVVGGKRKEESSSLLDGLVDRLNGGRKVEEYTKKKENAVVIDTQIVVMSESESSSRQLNTARSLAQSFDSVSGDNRLISKPYRKTFKFTDFDIKAERNRMSDLEGQHFLSLPGREALERHGCIERVETTETQVPEDLREGKWCIGTNVYKGSAQRAYLSTDREYQNLTLVVIGPTRAGKSTLIGNLGVDAIRAGECFIVFDFIRECELSKEIASLFPKDKILTIDCGDLKNVPGLGYNEIGHSADPLEQYDNAKRSSTQLQTLVNAIATSDSLLTPKMKRYLQSAAMVVFMVGGNIRDVFEVLQDEVVRHEFIERIPEHQNENLSKYVTSLLELDDYEVDKKTKKEVLVGTKTGKIDGVLDRLNELEQNTYLERMLANHTRGNIDLVKEIQKNQLICIKMPEWAYPTDGERDVICTYWMTKLWLALQIRSHHIPDRSQLTKVNIVIDELYQVKTTEKLLTEKLSRLAKFGCKPVISCHYLNQISGIRDELRSANASYMLISGCDKKNYKELESELYPYTEEDLLKLPKHHSLNLIKNNDGYARFITKLPAPIK